MRGCNPNFLIVVGWDRFLGASRLAVGPPPETGAGHFGLALPRLDPPAAGGGGDNDDDCATVELLFFFGAAFGGTEADFDTFGTSGRGLWFDKEAPSCTGWVKFSRINFRRWKL